MNTPIVDFVKNYASSNTSRLHMPGHKGKAFLGFENLDITEIKSADSLYEADGIIAQSEANASLLFDSEKTFFSTEGSSQCIRAMLFLAMQNAPKSQNRPRILASRNAHKTFITAAAILDIDVDWLWQQGESASVCSCNITCDYLSKSLSNMQTSPFAVYVTSPDYLGNTLDIKALAYVCKKFDVPLLVDNAHGAYHRFLQEPCHPINLGAALVCDSAHKTLPVITGGAYLHISKTAPKCYTQNAKQALALFGSTSPSYLILQSLDLCNNYLDTAYKSELSDTVVKVENLKLTLQQNGYVILQTEPLKLTVHASAKDESGYNIAELLRQNNVECEYADPDFLVLMFTPQNSATDFKRIISALGTNTKPLAICQPPLNFKAPQQALSIRSAMFANSQEVPTKQALGKICACPTVSCPPAIPIVISGEIISADAINIFNHYSIKTVSIVGE